MLDDPRALYASQAYTPKQQMMLEVGMRVHRLVVRGLNRNEDVVCQCDCGETEAVETDDWFTGARGQCSSCDAWENSSYVQQAIADPETYEALMSRARGAKDRCENPKNANFENYGGRGIRFMFTNLEHFAIHMWLLGWRIGDPRTTDRIDVDGGYEPENVRLAMPKEQVRNRRVTVVLDTGDEVISLADLAEQNGISTGSSEYHKLSAFVSKTKRSVYDQVMSKISEITDQEYI